MIKKDDAMVKDSWHQSETLDKHFKTLKVLGIHKKFINIRRISLQKKLLAIIIVGVLFTTLFLNFFIFRAEATNNEDVFSPIKNEMETTPYISSSNQEDYDYEYSGGYEVYFNKNFYFNDVPAVQFKIDNDYLAWKMPFQIKWSNDIEDEDIAFLQFSKFEIDVNFARYNEIYPNIDIEYEFLPHSFKENIVLKEPFSRPNIDDAYFSMDMSLEYPSDIMINSENNESFVTEDKIVFSRGNETIFMLGQPYAIDADYNVTHCRYVYEKDILSIQCPYEWLKNATYPVKIDSTVIPNEAALQKNGLSMAMGDFNNDTYDDFIVGTSTFNDPLYDGEKDGRVFLIYGGNVSYIDGEYELLILPTQRSDEQLGYSLAVGDFNRDGYDDALIGAPYNDKEIDNDEDGQTDEDGTEQGCAYIFFGGNYSSMSEYSMYESIPLKLPAQNGCYLVGFKVKVEMNATTYDNAVVEYRNTETEIYTLTFLGNILEIMDSDKDGVFDWVIYNSKY